ncbi:methyltransferase domain-containing protein [Microlunatus spumicola]
MVREWDNLAERRRSEISKGTDTSFLNTLMPAVKAEVQAARSRHPELRVLDVGCGTGELTVELLPLVDYLVGVDPSRRSIQLARQLAPAVPLHVSDLRSFSASHRHLFSVTVANMVLMNVDDLDSFTRDLAAVLQPGGTLIATLTHPWTWPRYWAYEGAPWFSYDSELFVQAGWKVSGAPAAAPEVSTHVHRPLGRYVQGLVDAGFAITGLLELGATSSTRGGRSVARPYPRFLLIRAQFLPE